MKQRCRPMRAFLTWGAGAAAVLGALSTQAAVLGHSRVVSLPDQPLRITVLLKDLSPAEMASVTATVAPSAAWQEAGLIAPVDLASFRLKTVTAAQPNALQLLLESSQVSDQAVIDVLLDIKTEVSTQRHQVSVLQSVQPTPIALAQSAARTAPPVALSTSNATTAAALTSPPQTHQIRAGQSLSGIARQYGSSDYSEQQLMAALLQANPHAFIHGNLNLIRAGAVLSIPEAHSIQAITPQQANQLYHAHLQWFDDYRQRLAQGQPITPMTQLSPSTVATALTDVPEPATASQTDRLQLSTEEPALLQADQNTALAQELAYTTERLAALDSSSSPVDGADANLMSALNPSTLNSTPDSSGSSQSVAPAATITNPPSAAVAAAEPVATPASAESMQSQLEADLKVKALWWGLALLSLMALAMTWFLRRSNTSRLDVVDELSPSAARMRDKLEKNADNFAPQTDEVEFREIK